MKREEKKKKKGKKKSQPSIVLLFPWPPLIAPQYFTNRRAQFVFVITAGKGEKGTRWSIVIQLLLKKGHLRRGAADIDVRIKLPVVIERGERKEKKRGRKAERHRNHPATKNPRSKPRGTPQTDSSRATGGTSP